MAEINSLVWNFAKALVAHAKDKFEKVTPAQYKERMEICLACPFLSEKKACKKCGCNMPLKAQWRTASCADKPRRWERLDVDRKEGADTAVSD